MTLPTVIVQNNFQATVNYVIKFEIERIIPVFLYMH